MVSMTSEISQELKLTFALMQVENVRELLKDGQFAGFFTSHLLPIKFEIERQLTNLTHSSKIKE